jgi:hypothetical protein
MKQVTRILSVLLIASILVSIGCEKDEPTAQSQRAADKELVGEPPLKRESNPQAEKAAVDAANAWLEVVDSGKYEQSWREAAAFFKNAVAKEKWQNSCEVFREPLGKVLSRELKATHYTTTAPGAPDGQYVIVQYNSSFENKESAVETVTPMLDNDDKWRVSGYYIK